MVVEIVVVVVVFRVVILKGAVVIKGVVLLYEVVVSKEVAVLDEAVLSKCDVLFKGAVVINGVVVLDESLNVVFLIREVVIEKVEEEVGNVLFCVVDCIFFVVPINLVVFFEVVLFLEDVTKRPR